MSRKETTEESYQVPIWVITFSDMTTNLLTFFVLLLSMGQMRDETLYDRGQAQTYLESVKRGFGFRETLDFGNVKIKYHTSDEGDLLEGRTIDARAEELRRILENLKQMTTIVSSQIVAEKASFSVANVHFSPGSDDLNEPAREFLRGFCLDLQQNVSRKPVELYVLGLASDGKSEKEQWLLSARRAQKVADFLRGTLSAAGGGQSRRNLTGGQFKWSVNSWGAGPGGDWVGRDSPISKRSQILIAVLRASD